MYLKNLTAKNAKEQYRLFEAPTSPFNCHTDSLRTSVCSVVKMYLKNLTAKNAKEQYGLFEALTSPFNCHTDSLRTSAYSAVKTIQNFYVFFYAIYVLCGKIIGLPLCEPLRTPRLIVFKNQITKDRSGN
jgi:hypothetical protein